MNVAMHASLAAVDAAAWDQLTSANDPFVEHAFLRALEVSQSVGTAQSGWFPCHLTLHHPDGQLLGAMPLYRRTDSFGEFIFDWAWADAAHRGGIAYYPKLTSAIPFTPATGARLLVSQEHRADAQQVRAALLDAALSLAKAEGASGLHVLFHQDDEASALRGRGLIGRLSTQYHWERRPGWHHFDDYLGAMRSVMRKQVRKERRQAQQSGLTLSMRRGSALSASDWRALYTFYRVTVWEKGAQAYLTEAFFFYLRDHAPDRVCAAMAHDEHQTPQAGALFLTRGTHLYGRYWGSLVDVPALHFELCYYLPIAWALENGITHFEAGAQGEHKIRRGFMPNACHSSHWLKDPRLMRAVTSFTEHEATHLQATMRSLEALGPFHREHLEKADS